MMTRIADRGSRIAQPETRSASWRGGLPLRAALLASFAEQPGRALLAALGIALGVALGLAVHLVNRSAANEFTLAAHSLAGEAHLVVRGPRAGFDEELYPRLARMPEVEAANPALDLEVAVAGRREPLRMLGLDPLRAAQVQPALLRDIGERLRELLEPGTVLLSRPAAQWLGVGPGGVVPILAGGEVRSLRVLGLLPEEAYRQRLAVMDIASAQLALERLGMLNRVDLRLRPGVDLEGYRAALAARLPPGVQVATPELEAERGAGLSRAYRVNLNMLALVALFTGAFLVFTTLALSVLRRRRELALLRVLGVTRAGVARLVLAEAAAIGAAGAALGVGAGHVLALTVLERFGPDLGAGYFSGVAAGLDADPAAYALFFALGLAAALLGALGPALETARAAPALALRSGDQERALARLRGTWPGIMLAAAALALTRAPPVDGIPVFGYLAVASLLVGTVLLAPRLAPAALALVPARGPVTLRLAAEQLRGAPGQAAVSMASILVSVSLMVSMVIMVASFRESLDRWLAQVLPADLYLRAAPAGEAAWFSPQDQERIRATPGVREARFLRSQNLWLDPARPPVSLLARPVDPARPDRALPLVGRWIVPAPDQPPPLWVSELVHDVYGFGVGRVVELPLGGRNARFTVAGVWRDYARQNGAICLEREVYAALTGDRLANDAAIWLEPGRPAGAAQAGLRAALGDRPGLQLAETGELRALSLSVFDRTFAVTYALEAIAVAIGLLGISVGAAAQVAARRGEFGMLRHVGMTRRQIASMLGIEGALVGGAGALLGIALGWLISLVLVHVVNRQSFHWSMDLHVPWAGLAALALALAAAAAATAVASGRAAMGADAVRAVREDW
jgi:putative ABC transport system permease protein